MQLISNMMIPKTINIWPLKNIVERKKNVILFFKYEEQVIWVPIETFLQILSSSNDPQMWILRRAHTWQIYPQGKEKFHLLSNIPEIRWPCSQVVDQPWHAKCLSCVSCAQPLREKCFVKNRYFQNHNQLPLSCWPTPAMCSAARTSSANTAPSALAARRASHPAQW